jgi:hypothetical protein
MTTAKTIGREVVPRAAADAVYAPPAAGKNPLFSTDVADMRQKMPRFEWYEEGHSNQHQQQVPR